MQPTRYQAIARKLIAQIESGVFRDGERLPSVRKIMLQEGVSLTTAARALQEVEDAGFATSKPRSGIYARVTARARTKPADEALQPTATARSGHKVTIHHMVEQIFHEAGSPGLVALGSAEIDARLQPYADLNRTLGAMARKLGAATTHYCLPPGYLPLRQQIARLMATRGIVTTPDDIVVTAGESEAKEIALRAVTRPGDLVAVESPTYFGILQWLEKLQLRAVEIATHPATGLSVEALERVMKRQRVAAIAINPTFQNPFGCVMAPDVARSLLALAAAHDVPVIEDDVYSDLYFGAARHLPVKAYDERDQVIYCSSLSKTLAPGLRIGWYVKNKARAALDSMQMTRNFGTSALPQILLAEYLGSGRYERHARGLRHLFAAQNPVIRAAILDAFPEGTKVSSPQGGYVYWVDVPAPFDAMQFRGKALQAGISLSPGPLFSASGRFANALRLCFGHAYTDGTARAIARLGALAGSTI